ncbi:probable 28S ribosomal protein S26, mitochondrial [Helicoverpa zea]|uniref:probable 28S ribosomal protein S26, mitochondrial n=1 Tax=Helicoverpa zea TaxID=7113 RepID=UPI001F56DC52|nr:probable 28S ribosomal protein S26, mitochondrial [Helicoverpa zea]
MLSQNSLLKRTWPMLVQSMEAHRKPRWLPVAKSKIYRIPKRPVIPEEERLELMRLHNNYKTQMRSIRRFYHEEMIKERSSRESASSEMSKRIEAEEWVKCVELNDNWNKQVAAEREERRKHEVAALEEYALKRMEALDKLKEAKIAKAAEEIRKQKELSKTFITPETIDAAIDHAIANPVDYNFAIDLKGNKYEGRDTQITRNQGKQEKAASANA